MMINLSDRKSWWVIQLYYPRVCWKEGREFFIDMPTRVRAVWYKGYGFGFEIFGFGIGILYAAPPKGAE